MSPPTREPDDAVPQDRLDRLERLYEKARHLPEGQRTTFLDEHCADDPTLRAELESLLADATEAEAFMEALGRVEVPDASRGEVAERLDAALEGRYRIEREIGQGGMAIVYLAHDLRHDRDVALKVLMPELAAIIGAERFLQEIQTTANLQHPHILPLFDSGEADGFLYYVMPYVEGESLRARLDRERQLPVDDAVAIAAQVASALEYAHEVGIVHRDIKPANILLSRGGPVVADFGIALALSAAGGGRLTETGLSLGTPHYMSPEQATGDRHVGPATDIYAVGCVLYETLVGEPPYTGTTPQAVLGKILRAEPVSPTEERQSVPLHVDAAIRRALERLPADRFRTAGAFARALADPGFRHGRAPEAVARGTRSRATIAALGAISAALAVVAIWGWMGRGAPPTPARVSHLAYVLPEDHRLAVAESRALPLALSPDGGTLAYVGESGAGTHLYVRELGGDDARALPGTDGARQPFFSWDGAEIGYFANGTVYRVRSSGEAPVPITTFEGVPAGGAWGPGGLIVFAADSALWRASTAGGARDSIALPAPIDEGWPTFLPPGAGGSSTPWVLVTLSGELHAVSVTGEEVRPLGINGRGLYVSGSLVYTLTSGVVRAVPFDLGTLTPTGSPISVRENVFRPNQTYPTLLALAPGGTLAYVEGTDRRLVLVDRAGRETTLPFEPAAYRHPRISPDGGRVLVHRRQEGGGLFILDLENGRELLLTAFYTGTWSPRGDEVLTQSDGRFARFSVAPGSQGVPISDERVAMVPAHWGEDGVVLLFTADPRRERRGGLYTMTIDGSEPVRELLDTDADEWDVTRSPDGRWIAYASDLSGRHEVYIRGFPAGEPRQVSIAGGRKPLFSRDGEELYYLSGEQAWAVALDGLEEGGPLRPEHLFRGSYVIMGPAWDVRPQGDFVMVSAGPNWLREIQVLQGWNREIENLFEERRLP